MRVRKMRAGKELKTIGDEMMLLCPLCQALWLKEVEGDYHYGDCGHLRFIWWAGAHSNPPEFLGQWDADEFAGQCLRELNRLLSQEGDDEPYEELPGIADSDFMRKILQNISSPGIDSMWEYEFTDEYCTDGGGKASGFFGIKNN